MALENRANKWEIGASLRPEESPDVLEQGRQVGYF
jgi:hypothetical protein